MRFVVGDTVTDNSKNGELPSKLRDVPFPPNKEGLDQSFEFQRKNGQWKINGVSWADGPEERVMAKPKRGSVERWKLKNGSGGWTHPIHIHLIDFQIVSRTGSRGVRPYEAVALKDVVWLNTNEEVNIIARYAPWDGLYMVSNVQPFHSNRVTHVSDVFGFSRFSRFLKYVVAMLTRLQFHCHNLIHEDHEMMAAPATFRRLQSKRRSSSSTTLTLTDLRVKPRRNSRLTGRPRAWAATAPPLRQRPPLPLQPPSPPQQPPVQV
jgi:bilirubin oxidase